MTLPAATLALGKELIRPTSSPASVSLCRASAMVSPATLGTFTVWGAEGLACGLFSCPRKSNQPFAKFGPMTLLRMPMVPRKNRIVATRIKNHGMRLRRRRTGAGREAGTLLVGPDAATGACCGRVVAAATGDAVVGSRPLLIFQRSSARSSAEA